MDISYQHAKSLVEKLNSLDLTSEEREILGRLLIHDGLADVEGFRSTDYFRNLPPIQGFNIGMPPASSFNRGVELEPE